MSTEVSPPLAELGKMLEMEAKNLTGECFGGSSDQGVDVVGLVAIIIFYAAVLAVGIWASWRTRKTEQNQEQVGWSVGDREPVNLINQLMLTDDLTDI